MAVWQRYPTIYEINTWVWLAELAAKIGKPVDLGSVPASEWDNLRSFGFDAVWFMGVWQRSPAGIAIANRNQNLLADFRVIPLLHMPYVYGVGPRVRGGPGITPLGEWRFEKLWLEGVRP